MHITRRSMLVTASAGLAALHTPGILAADETRPPSPQNDGPTGSSFPTQEPSLVKEMVGASHVKIDRVRELLAERPALAKAAWDWGFGDWETALGAASHVGSRDIAALLMKHGARPDIFTFAMLGHLDVVKAYIEASPGIQRTPGPHGITLLAHAKAGGEESAPVAEYLAKLGDADIGQISQPLSDESKKLCIGEYTFGQGPDARFIVADSRFGRLTIQRGASGNPLQLFHQGNHKFHPTGAPAVEIAFEMKGDAISGVRIKDGVIKLTAKRV